MHPYWDYVRPAISLIIKVSADDHSYHLRFNSTKLGFGGVQEIIIHISLTFPDYAP